MAEIGEMSVRIWADTRDFVQDLGRADSRLGKLRQTMGRASIVAAKYASAVAAAGAVVGGAMVRNSMRNIDAQAKLARSLDTTTASLAALNSVAGDAGVAQGQLTSSLQSFNKRMGDAVNGVGEASKMYERLGINARELAELPLDERMQAVAEAVNELGTAAERGAALDRLMSGGRSLTVFFQQGADAISDAATQMEALGVAVTDVDATKIEQANIALAGISDVITGISNRIAIKLAPYLQAVAEELVNWAVETRGFEDAVQSSFEFALKAAGWLGDAFHANRIAMAAMNHGVSQFGNAVVQAMRLAADAIGAVIDIQIAGINMVIRGLNNIPKVDIETVDPFTDGSLMQAMQDFANESRITAQNSRRNLEEIWNAEWPSEKIEEFLKRVEERSNEVSQQVVKDRQSAFDALTGNGGAGGEDGEEIDYQKRLDKLREFVASEAELEQQRHEQRLEDLRNARERELVTEQEYNELKLELEQEHQELMTELREGDYERRLERLREHLMSEEEVEQEQFETHMEWLREALDLEMITKEEYREMERELEQQHMSKIKDIRAKGMSDLEKLQNASMGKQLSEFAAAGNQMISAAGQINEGMARAAQIGGAAQAFIATLVGQAEALKLGWPAGPIAAAKIAAQGFGLVAAIKGASTKGAGTTVGTGSQGFNNAGSGGGGTTADQADTTPTQTIQLNMHGDGMFSEKQVRGLIRQLVDAQKDGAKLVLG